MSIERAFFLGMAIGGFVAGVIVIYVVATCFPDVRVRR
jgi:fructose-specific phosphotransferase system IIC component